MNRLDKQKQKRGLQIKLDFARKDLYASLPKLREQLAAVETHILTATGGVLEHPRRSEKQNFYIAERQKLMTERRLVNCQIEDLITTEREIATEWTRY